MAGATARREALEAVRAEACRCERCPQLAAARTTVVFGEGDPDAALMLVDAAPGGGDDRAGRPLSGREGALLDELLAGIGLRRSDVFVACALKCHPPGNRDAAPGELSNCEGYLWRQLELVEPVVVATLGNFATKLLRHDPTPVTQLRGHPEVRVLGPRTVRLLPLLHPAAALYQPANAERLRADVALIPELIAQGAPEQDRDDAADGAAPSGESPAVGDEAAPEAEVPPGEDQLGLF